MVHRTDIQYDLNRSANNVQQVGIDPWGGDYKADWRIWISDLHCRFFFEKASASRLRSVQDSNKRIDESMMKLLVPMATSISADHRVGTIIDSRRQVVATGPFRIDEVMPRRGHQELRLVLIK